jgi:DNA-binding NarL/FixJ family response regulator
VVVVVGKGAELELALGALEELDLGVRVIPTAVEAERALLTESHPRVAAVLASLVQDPARGLALIRALRAARGLASVPIAVWAPATAPHLLSDAYRLGASSGVLLDGTHEDPVRLARMIHYWAVANEPYAQEAYA